MKKPDRPYRKRTLGDRSLSPETLAMSYGYDAGLSEGSIKPPVFMTSTFVFSSAEEGAAAFQAMEAETVGSECSPELIYSRLNNPNVEILEDRLTLFDEAEDACVLASGMAAITTVLMAHANSGDTVLHSTPIYGGSETLIRNVLPLYGIESANFIAGASEAEIRAAADDALASGRIAAIYTETPTNPTNEIVDLGLMKTLADEIGERQGARPPVIVDNTMLGPIGQKPLAHGADMVVYSLTKYIGGHSDVIGGAVLGDGELIGPVRALRSAIGTNLDPHACWLFTRSLETLKLRMTAAFAGARTVAEYLRTHPKVEKVRYLGFLEPGARDYELHHRQAGENYGSTFSFDVVGGRDGAFRLLNALKIIKLAVSLGGAESLVCHPGTTSHSGVDPTLRKRLGFTEGLVRVSIGLEDPGDLIADFEQALEHV